MLKKIPQDDDVKPGDIVFYKNIFGFNECPMVVLMSEFSKIRIRYYDGTSHHGIYMEKDLFISIGDS